MKLDLFLLRVAMESAAQEAARLEIARQLAYQLGDEPVTVVGPINCDVVLTAGQVTVDGQPVEWVNDVTET